MSVLRTATRPMLEEMGLDVIHGPPNSGRAPEMLARFRAALDRDPVLVVPTGDDVAGFEKQLCDQAGATLGGSISTFAALTGEITRALAADVAPPLSVAQRQALVRAAVKRAAPRLLRRSARRPGFTPALDALIAELQAALIEPAEFARMVADLDDPGFETELAAMYGAYVELRDAGGRSDPGLVATTAIAALRADPAGWGRPVFVYGFDDFGRAQLELVDALARASEVTVAVTYADRRALSVRAGLLTALEQELGGKVEPPLPFEQGYTTSPTLRHLDRNLFEAEAGRIAPDDGLRLLRSAGPRGEAEAIGVAIARLLNDGHEADEIVVVVRRPDAGGALLASVLRGLGIPVALEASAPLSTTCVGTALIALCRAAGDDTDVEALLTHLRSDPSMAPGPVDNLERRLRRGDAQSVSAAVESWQQPPRHLGRLREAGDDRARLRALARSARELAEGAHRRTAPLAGGGNDGEVPFSALELRGGVIAAELLIELAGVGELPGCEQPGLADAIEALESASVPHWRGPASGRVRILSPYRARAARARTLFVASLQDGEFPSASPLDPLLSEERRRQLGNSDLRRAEQADEERYLFHSCASRPTERLCLSWQHCDEDGGALARSPFIDEVLDLVEVDPDDPGDDLLTSRGPERAVLATDEATSPRALARALALAGWGADRSAALAGLGIGGEQAARTLGLFSGLPHPESLPGPLRAPAVLEQIAGRDVFSANSLEGWVTCSYRWFVEHELSPSGSSLRPTRCGSAASSTMRSSGSTASPRATTRCLGPATSAAGASASAPCSSRSRRSAQAPRSTAPGAPSSIAPGSRSTPSSSTSRRWRASFARTRTCSSSASAPSARSSQATRRRARRCVSAISPCAAGSTASISPPTAAAPSSATTRQARTSLRRESSRVRGRCRSSSTCSRYAACSSSIRWPGSISRWAPPTRRSARPVASPSPTTPASPSSTSYAPTASPRTSSSRRSRRLRREPSRPPPGCAQATSTVTRSTASARSTAPSSRSAASSGRSESSARRTSTATTNEPGSTTAESDRRARARCGAGARRRHRGPARG